MTNIEEDVPTDIMIRGARIREDANGHWNLNDIWALRGSPATRAPKHWRGNKAVKRLIDALQKKVTAGYLLEKKANIPVIYSERGRGNEGTFAHPILAASYAGYLVTKPNAIRHLVENVLNEFSPTRGSFAAQGVRTIHEK